MTSKATVKINTQIFRSKDNDNISQFGVVLLLSGSSGIFLLQLFRCTLSMTVRLIPCSFIR